MTQTCQRCYKVVARACLSDAEMMNCKNLERSMLKPYMLVEVHCQGYSYVGQVMSYVTPDRTILVRRAPGHPGTLSEVPVNCVTLPYEKYTWVHYALIKSVHAKPPYSSFPIDMLRYDHAAPVNFDFIQVGEDLVMRPISEDDKIFFKEAGEQLLIAKCTRSGVTDPWTIKRWESFLWTITPLKSERIER